MMSAGSEHFEPSVFSEGFSPLEEVAETMFLHTGINIGVFSQDFLLRRITERIAACALNDVQSYAMLLKASSEERTALFDTFGIQVTSFFRNPAVFTALEASLLPGLVRDRASRTRENLRVWSVGCSTGEEAYSMAILLGEVLKRTPLKGVVFGSDISHSALETARRAVYHRDAMGNVRLRTLDTCFRSEEDGYRVRNSIRSMVHFSHADITARKGFQPDESIFRNYDVILCRNVLIYYRETVRKRILDNLISMLSKNGYLILGSSERLHTEYRSLFARTYGNLPIYRKIRDNEET